jgi:hypothetical protein
MSSLERLIDNAVEEIAGAPAFLMNGLRQIGRVEARLYDVEPQGRPDRDVLISAKRHIDSAQKRLTSAQRTLDMAIKQLDAGKVVSMDGRPVDLET